MIWLIIIALLLAIFAWPVFLAIVMGIGVALGMAGKWIIGLFLAVFFLALIGEFLSGGE